MTQNLVEKIAERYRLDNFEKGSTTAGDYVQISPEYIMTHDNSAAVIKKFEKFNQDKVFDPNQIVFTLDHDIQNKDTSNLSKYRKIEKFANAHKIDFYPAGRGIGHQVMIEEGYVFPGSFVCASDSHSNMYGAMGAMGTPLVRTDAAMIWLSGHTWWRVPEVVRVDLQGKLHAGVTGKDLIISLCGIFDDGEVSNKAIIFTGEGINSLSIDSRMSISNMTTEWGALAGIFPFDDMLKAWFKTHMSKLSLKDDLNQRWKKFDIEELEKKWQEIRTDKGYEFDTEITIELSTLEPSISGPNSVKKMNKITNIQKDKIKIDKAYLVSCVNSRVEDLAQAARILEGKKVDKNVELYVAAASEKVQEESELRGDWQILIDAGAKILPPGCGPCIGLGAGTLEEGEVGISATNRNFRGRMGHKDAQAYLASPEIVAYSAISGYISGDPNASYLDQDISYSIEKKPESLEGNVRNEYNIIGINEQEIKTAENKVLVGNLKIKFEDQKVYISKEKNEINLPNNIKDLFENFPEYIELDLIVIDEDNMNTDGIYGGKYTYKQLDENEQSKVAFLNYSEDINELINRVGDYAILAGENWGVGSSREQAATALKYSGCRILVAKSVNETYRRNAINNGLLVLEI
jgi:homoaconitate hydratase